MDTRAWIARHDARVVEKAPRRSRVGLVVGAVAWVAFAILLAAVAVDSGGADGLRGFALPIVAALAIAAWLVWRAVRFRIVGATALDGGVLQIVEARGTVMLQPGDVRQVVQLSRNPFGAGVYNMANAAWGAWFRVDASVGGGRVRRYVAWRPDAATFLRQLRDAGFPLAGDVTAVPTPS